MYIYTNLLCLRWIHVGKCISPIHLIVSRISTYHLPSSPPPHFRISPGHSRHDSSPHCTSSCCSYTPGNYLGTAASDWRLKGSEDAPHRAKRLLASVTKKSLLALLKVQTQETSKTNNSSMPTESANRPWQRLAKRVLFIVNLARRLRLNKFKSISSC